VFATANLLGYIERHYVQPTKLLDRQARKYDFEKRKDTEMAKEIRASWRAGRLAYLHGPVLVYGPAAWSGLSEWELDVWQGLFAELTKHAKSARPDRARVIRYPNCPLLPDGPHVTFAGNFRTKEQHGGRGFRLIGPTNRGWLSKAGINLRNERQPLAMDNRVPVREFLRALAGLEEKFGATAAGRLGETWLNSTAMLALVNSQSEAEWTALMDLRLRVYAPTDYLDRVLTYFRKQGGFAETRKRARLAVRINGCGMKKKEIAQQVGISPSALSQFLSGRRAWPARVREALETLLEASE